MAEIITLHCSTIKEPIFIPERMIIMPVEKPTGIVFNGINSNGNNMTVIGALYSCGIYHANVEWLKQGLNVNDIQSIINAIRLVGIQYLKEYQYFIKPYNVLKYQKNEYQKDEIKVTISPTKTGEISNFISIKHYPTFAILLKDIHLTYPTTKIIVDSRIMYLMKIMGTLLTQWQGYPINGKIVIRIAGKKKIPVNDIAKELKKQRNIRYYIESVCFLTI